MAQQHMGIEVLALPQLLTDWLIIGFYQGRTTKYWIIAQQGLGQSWLQPYSIRQLERRCARSFSFWIDSDLNLKLSNLSTASVWVSTPCVGLVVVNWTYFDSANSWNHTWPITDANIVAIANLSLSIASIADQEPYHRALSRQPDESSGLIQPISQILDSL